MQGWKRGPVTRKANTSKSGAALRQIVAVGVVTIFVFLVPGEGNSQRVNRQAAPRFAQQARPQAQQRQQARQQLQLERQQERQQLRQRQPEQRQLPQRQYSPVQGPNVEQAPIRPNAGGPIPREGENRQQAPAMTPARPAYPGGVAGGLQPTAEAPTLAAESQRNTAQRPAVTANKPATGAGKGTPNVRPALPGGPAGASNMQRQTGTNPGASPPGHLGSWLNQHSDLPVQGQQKLLGNDPSFKSLPKTDQQRLIQQLQQVNQLSEEQRQRRLARAEAIERMTPQERMQLNQSTRQLAALPADRQTLVRRAFRDLRGVPLDQRQTVLDSQRYQGQFTPEERGILNNLLRAEPYEQPK